MAREEGRHLRLWKRAIAELVARVGPWLESRGPFSAGPFAVDRFVLYESLLNRAAAHYEALRDFPLREEYSGSSWTAI